MIDGLPFGIVDIGAGGILVIAIIMVFTGRLVPKRFYDEMLGRLKEQQSVNDDQQEINKGLVEMNKALISKEDLAAKAIEAMRENAAWQRRVIGQDRTGSRTSGTGEET